MVLYAKKVFPPRTTRGALPDRTEPPVRVLTLMPSECNLFCITSAWQAIAPEARWFFPAPLGLNVRQAGCHLDQNHR